MFNKVVLKIENLNHEVVLHYMITTLWLCPFTNDLCMTSPTSMDELRKLAAKFMQLQDVWKFMNNILVETMSAKKKEVNQNSTQRSISHQMEFKNI